MGDACSMVVGTSAGTLKVSGAVVGDGEYVEEGEYVEVTPDAIRMGKHPKPDRFAKK